MADRPSTVGPRDVATASLANNARMINVPVRLADPAAEALVGRFSANWYATGPARLPRSDPFPLGPAGSFSK